MDRYFWTESAKQTSRIELIDKLTDHLVAIIVADDSGTCFWNRYTSQIVHGVAAAEGSTRRGLQEAKRQVVDGLPDGPGEREAPALHARARKSDN